MPTKTIDGVVLSDLVEGFLGSTLQHCSIPRYLADKLQAIDFDNQYIHIEHPSEDNGLARPRMWRITDWRTSSIREERKKALSACERNVAVHLSEVRCAAIRKVRLSTGLNEENAETIIAGIIKQRNQTAAELFDINLSALIEADTQLSEYKRKNGIK